MPARKPEIYSLGGVDSRSNPANYPPDRALRCLNFAPQPSGALRLRYGYSVPLNTKTTAAPFSPIHSAIYYEEFSAAAIGPQNILCGKLNFILNSSFVDGVPTSEVIGDMPNGNPWGHFRANNRIHLADGEAVGLFGAYAAVGTHAPVSAAYAMQNWDGTTLRPTGIPTFGTPSGFFIAPAVSLTSSTSGSIAPTSLSGYQLYAAWYNPITQHVGNCLPIGSRMTLNTTASAFLVTVPPPFLAEWVTALGMTNDGGQLPYWLIDNAGNNIVVANNQTNATVLIGNVNTLEELPFRNFVPPVFDKFARVGTRIFANLSGSPFIYYSNDVSDVQNANYVGNPEESWPLDQAESFPTGELPTAIHGYRFEGWFFSRQNLAIWSTLLQQQGANPWRGPWPGGCAGQRAFVETPYGPYWVTGDKQLATFMDDGVISVSEEYEASLLADIADDTLSQTEIAYILDPMNLIDELVIKGLDANGNPVIVVHDFLLKDQRSPFGCGYTFEYTGATLQTFVGAGFTPRANARDVMPVTQGRMRLWAGCTQGFFAQLEDGSNSDNGATYSADHIGLLNTGTSGPGIEELQFQGDKNLQVSYLLDYSLGLDGFNPSKQDLIPGESSVWGANLGGNEARWFYCRIQLTAHPADGNFAITDPPFLPLPTYGVVNGSVLKLGSMRPEKR